MEQLIALTQRIATMEAKWAEYDAMTKALTATIDELTQRIAIMETKCPLWEEEDQEEEDCEEEEEDCEEDCEEDQEEEQTETPKEQVVVHEVRLTTMINFACVVVSTLFLTREIHTLLN
jgi:hypothetical protein